MLRNRVGAISREALAAADNDLVEVRVAELRDSPSAVVRTYDLLHFKALHQLLFQDVYMWAGEFDQLLSESGRGLAWDAIALIELHRACHIARAEQNIEPLRLMFARIVNDAPAYIFD